MTTKTAVIVIILGSALVACSAIFDMDRYDKGSPGGRRPNDSSSGDGVDGAASSSGAMSSDASTSSSSGDSSTEPKCNVETEPNDDESQANVMVLGGNCGSLSSEADEDYFVFTLASQTRFDSAGTAYNVKGELNSVPPGTNITWTGGGSSLPLEAGTYRVHLSYNPGSGGEPTYVITLGE
jgi:hypothetical protein